MSSQQQPRFPTPPPTYLPTPAAHEQISFEEQQHNDGVSVSRLPPPRNQLLPYLTLPYLLSLTWLAYPVLSLLFIAFRLSLSSDGAQDAVGDAKEKLLASCKAAEGAASVAGSLPRYLAQGTNQQIVDAVNGSMNAARASLIFSLTALEGVVNFIIDMYRSTFLCFLELAVRGGLSIMIAAVQEISTAVTGALNGIRTGIQGDIASANSAISTAVAGINKVTSIVNVHLDVPQFSIPSLDGLNNVQIPTDFEDALIRLNSSLPTLDDLKEKVEAVIAIPFDKVKADINSTFSGLSFNQSLLSVPPQRTLSFCSDLDTSIIDDLGRDLLKITRVGVILVIVCAFLLIGFNCVVEWWKWRRLQKELETTRQAWQSDPTVVHHSTIGNPTISLTDHNLMTLLNTSQHPLLTHLTNKFTNLFNLSTSGHNAIRWFFSYIFHPAALACFLIGVFGLISVELQLAAISPLQAHYSKQVANSVADFSSTIANSMNTVMANESATYAQSANVQIISVQDQINDGLFGWVNDTTSTLNNTLVTFYSEIQNAINTTFGGTVLDAPMQEFIRCLIGTKIENLETALTFVHDNLKVSFPTVNETILVLTPENMNEITQPISLAAVGNGDDKENTGLVGRIINRYIDSLKKERLMFGVFLGLWGIVVLIALIVVLWHGIGLPCLERHRRRTWQKERGGFIIPWTLPTQSTRQPPSEEFFGGNEKKISPYGADVGKEEEQLKHRSFAPLSPRRRFTSLFNISSSTVSPSQSQESQNAQQQGRYPPVATNGRRERSWEFSPTSREDDTHSMSAAGNAGIGSGVVTRSLSAWLRRVVARRDRDGESTGEEERGAESFRSPSPPRRPSPPPPLPVLKFEKSKDYDAMPEDHFAEARRAPPPPPPRQKVVAIGLPIAAPIPIAGPLESPFMEHSRRRDFPQSVHSIDGLYPGGVPPSPTMATGTATVPLHHHFVQFDRPAARSSSPSPPPLPSPTLDEYFHGGRRPSSQLLAPPSAAPSRSGSPAPSQRNSRRASPLLPPPRKLTNNNPFATPFDDDYHIAAVKKHKRNSSLPLPSTPNNPFGTFGVAM